MSTSAPAVVDALPIVERPELCELRKAPDVVKETQHPGPGARKVVDRPAKTGVE